MSFRGAPPFLRRTSSPIDPRTPSKPTTRLCRQFEVSNQRLRKWVVKFEDMLSSRRKSQSTRCGPSGLVAVLFLWGFEYIVQCRLCSYSSNSFPATIRTRTPIQSLISFVLAGRFMQLRRLNPFQ